MRNSTKTQYQHIWYTTHFNQNDKTVPLKMRKNDNVCKIFLTALESFIIMNPLNPKAKSISVNLLSPQINQAVNNINNNPCLI